MTKAGATKTKANGQTDEPDLDPTDELKAAAGELKAAADELKAALLAPDDFDTVDIEIDGIGTVTVKPLSRDDSYLVAQKKNVRDAEAQMIVLGMVHPPLTFPEALALAKKRAGIVQTITDVISDISGMGEGARKEAMTTFLEQPGD